MDTDNYEQNTLAEELLGEQAQWLSEGLEGITALLAERKYHRRRTAGILGP